MLDRLTRRDIVALIFLGAAVIFALGGTITAVSQQSWSVFLVMALAFPALFFSIFLWILGVKPFQWLIDRKNK